MKEPKINWLGEQAILLEWQENCTPELLHKLLRLETDFNG